MSAATIYRVQDHEGRGPFRPGCSQFWADLGVERPPAWMQEFPLLAQTISESRRNLSYGCGCRTLRQLSKWFLPSEREKLRSLGYMVVSLEADEVLAGSDSQVVFACRRSLAKAATWHQWETLP